MVVPCHALLLSLIGLRIWGAQCGDAKGRGASQGQAIARPRKTLAPPHARTVWLSQPCCGAPMRHDDNLTTDRQTFVTHLECSMTGERYEADQLHGLSRVGRPLLVRYDLEGVKAALTPDVLAQRPADLWRYRE